MLPPRRLRPPPPPPRKLTPPRGGVAKATADAPGAQAALAPELPKGPCGDAGGMVEDAEEIPGRPVFSVGALPIENSRQIAQQRGSKLGSPGREIGTNDFFEIT
jgi:hypothetical protein